MDGRRCRLPSGIVWLLMVMVWSLTSEPPSAAAAEALKAVIRNTPRVTIVGKYTPKDGPVREVSTVGVNLRAEGLIVVTLGAIEGLKEVQVVAPDGERLKPTAIVQFPQSGIAAIAVDAKEKFKVPATAQEVLAGETIWLLGPTFDGEKTVVTGIISRLGGKPPEEWLLTDAAICSGTTQGVAFNLEGELVGVVASGPVQVTRLLPPTTIEHLLRKWGE